jgi:hypothetical protein
MGNYYLISTESQFQVRNLSEWLYNNVSVFNITENYTHKIVKMINYMLNIFCHNIIRFKTSETPSTC